MIVRSCWPLCEYRNGSWKSPPMDAFWVEATHEEATEPVFPLLSPAKRCESEQASTQCEVIAGVNSQPPGPFCFLVARDLSSIDPFPLHYPFHILWNACSPFRRIPERAISHLDQLAENSTGPTRPS